MASANSSIQVSDLDFNSIKSNFITFLQSQDTFKDYNFQGSGLSVLLDILAYNTQYNAFYLNMVANEMFLDSALQRSSVVSHAKLLNYVPSSAIAPTAIINLAANTSASSLTIPKFTNFMSEAINGINYNFVTTTSNTVNSSGGVASFNNVTLKQGIPTTYTFVVNSTTNPSYIFELPDANVDTSTLQVFVQQSATNSNYTIYQPASNYLTLNSSSTVYFLQESLNGNYQVYFGDGVLGQQLTDGNLVIVSYISTDGTMATGANNFVLMDNINGASSVTILPQVPATQGAVKETVDSIKFQAPKSFAAQGRAVTKNDYITALQQNNLGFNFDAVNVWGGEENNPPAYGQVFVSLKPSGSYALTDSQKQIIRDQIIKPISVMTVVPTIVDPDYTYVKLLVDVYYDPTKTTQTSQQIQSGVNYSLQSYLTSALNNFNSTFSPYDILSTIQNYDSSIITGDYKLQLQKQFFPNLNNPTSYNLYYGTSLAKSTFATGVSSSPPIQYVDPTDPTNIIDGVFFEEVPQTTNSVESISVLNPGFGYQVAPNITITGDGIGATAHATIFSDGSLASIVVDTAGSGYSSAIATVTPQSFDTTGQGGSVVVNLTGKLGTLRTYYNDVMNVKTILNPNAGLIDYQNGIISINNFSPVSINNDFGQFSMTANPSESIISSSYNRILTLDIYDPSSIIVNVIAKSS
jgi:hypothetical protein